MLFILARTDFKYHEGDSGTGIIICIVFALCALIDYLLSNHDKKQ